MSNARLLEGDCLVLLDTLDENSIDSCVTDPPYHLTSIVKRFGGENSAPAKDKIGAFKRQSAGFMGKAWDGGDIAFRAETWAKVLRALKPGAFLVAFSAPRNYHRMACAIEDAGFIVRDQIMWLFGTGFPKSHNIAKALAAKGDPDAAEFEGLGTALKPAHEPCVLAQKPLSEATFAANVKKWGTGALNIAAARIPSEPRPQFAYFETGAKSGYSGGLNGAAQIGVTDEGRWPANLAHDGSDEVEREFSAFGQSESRGGVISLPAYDGLGGGGAFKIRAREFATPCDAGSQSRFFYCAKAGEEDRLGSKHPTVKPVALMRWLVRLVTPPGGLVLDPFAGTGTTLAAALAENRRAIGIEREPEYQADIKARLARIDGADTPLFAAHEEAAPAAPSPGMLL